MKYFCCADIHGDYGAFMRALNKYGYSPKDKTHQLVVVGDFFGRAEIGTGDSKSVWDYLRWSAHANAPICIKGNHESILENIFRRNNLEVLDIQNGEHHTIASFSNSDPVSVRYDMNAVSRAAKTGIEEWLKNLPWYHETKTHIFVHGFLPKMENGYDWYTEDFATVTDTQWEEASWAITPSEVARFRNKFPTGIQKTIVFGHWTTKDLYRKIKPFDRAKDYGEVWTHANLNMVGLDCTTALTHNIEMYVFEE